MGNTKTEYKREDLLTAYMFVNSALDIDIADKKRETKYVLGRTLYYMIALKTTNASNERAYRDLSAEDRLDYDYRASNVLKSFEWKKKELSRKEVFEIINVGM